MSEIYPALFPTTQKLNRPPQTAPNQADPSYTNYKPRLVVVSFTLYPPGLANVHSGCFYAEEYRPVFNIISRMQSITGALMISEQMSQIII